MACQQKKTSALSLQTDAYTDVIPMLTIFEVSHIQLVMTKILEGAHCMQVFPLKTTIERSKAPPSMNLPCVRLGLISIHKFPRLQLKFNGPQLILSLRLKRTKEHFRKSFALNCF